MNDNIYYLVVLGSLSGLLLASSVVFFYTRYQRRILQQRVAMQQTELAHRQQLLFATIQSQENERLRISKDLHDHVGSALSNLRLMVSYIRQHTNDTAEAAGTISQYKAGIDALIEDVRNLSHSLSPAGLSLWGLRETLDAFCEKTSISAGISIRINDPTGDILKRLNYDDSLSVFRVCQELITNTLKHANAQTISIDIASNNGAIITYKDDGTGITPTSNRPGIGLYNIESRLSMINATYNVASSPGDGYKFTIHIPQQKFTIATS